MRPGRLLERDSGAAIFLLLAAIATTTVGVLSRQPLLLLALNVIPPYLVFLDRVRLERHSGALGLMVFWAFCQSTSVILLVQAAPEASAEAVFRGVSYREEMFRWIQTGIGREGDWRLFLPQHAIHYGSFLVLSALTAGAAGLTLGAALLNYMSFYVGSLFLADTEGAHTLRLVLMGWPIWSIVRVVGFIAGAVAAADLSFSIIGRLRDRPLGRPDRSSFYISLSLALVILDLLLKGLLAPHWRLMLAEVIVRAPIVPGP